MSDVRWLDEREARAWRSLQFMQMQLNARLGREIASCSNLSFQDYGVLAALTDKSDGRMRLFALGRELGWEKSRLSHHISRMAERNLVTREACPSDRRGSFVAVTKQGRREIRAAAPDHVEAVRRLFIDRLTPLQLDAITAAAETVLAALASEADAAPIE